MLQSIELTNFRRHRELVLDFDENFNLIHGRNNAGKSTIFYAIEYAQFGRVSGFKKISQLVSFGEKRVAVDLFFLGKDGECYQLHRSHKVGKRSVKGVFDLRQKSDPNSKTYSKSLLSTENGNNETDLSLKLSELIGMSRRFFETAIHFYQGSISEILKGSAKLDIVFGITAANALIDGFKSLIKDSKIKLKGLGDLQNRLEQAQETKNLGEESIKSINEELAILEQEIEVKKKTHQHLNRLKKIETTLRNHVDTYEGSLSTLDDKKNKSSMIQEEIDDFKMEHDMIQINDLYSNKKKQKTSLEKEIDNMDENIEKLKEEIYILERKKGTLESNAHQLKLIQNEIEEITSDWGDKDTIQSDIENKSKEKETLIQTIEKIGKKTEAHQETIRTAERSLGDINGILSRREESKNNPKCEYCGASIDPDTIEKEIHDLKLNQTKLKKKISTSEAKIKTLKKEEKKSRGRENKLGSNLNELDTILKDLNQLNEKIGTIKKESSSAIELEKIAAKIKKSEKSLTKQSQSVQEAKNILKTLGQDLSDLERVIDQNERLKKNLKKAENQLSEIAVQVEMDKKDLQIQLAQINEQLKSFLDDNPNFHLDLNRVHKILRNNVQKFRFETLLNAKETLVELNIAKNSEISTAISLLDRQKSEIIKRLSETKSRLEKVLRDIKTLQQQATNLLKLKKTVDQYKKYRDIFTKLQNHIRVNLSQALQKLIHQYHKKLSVDNEFREIRVDPEDYSVSVVPQDSTTDEAYPATVYQGGGHKLILGLAYKFALGSLIGTPPYILIDEPTEFMDQNNRSQLLSNLSNLSLESQILLITHQEVEKIKSNNKIHLKK
ncbi:MAG: AAA family ATPase [Promethearchaeota archaeon]